MNKLKNKNKTGTNTPEFFINTEMKRSPNKSVEKICFKKSFNLSFANSDSETESAMGGKAEGVSHTSNIFNDNSYEK